MFQRKQRRFRRRSNGRNLHHSKEGSQNRLRPGSYSNSNGQNRFNFRNSLSAEKLFEKYTSLAKEAMSSGDKTLSENYLQHADHFMRIIDEKNKNKIIGENKTSDSNNLPESKKDFSQETSINQNKNSENKN